MTSKIKTKKSIEKKSISKISPTKKSTTKKSPAKKSTVKKNTVKNDTPKKNLEKKITPKALAPQILALTEMIRARTIDEKAITLYKQNKCFFQIGCGGHEAVGVAFAQAMKPAYDWFYPYYRDMALCCGLGMTTEEFFLNILSKEEDPNSGGRQMAMHYGHKNLNIVSQSSPTGTQFLQAVGALRCRIFSPCWP